MAVQKFTNEIPGTGCGYEKSLWVPTVQKGGNVSAIWGGVRIETKEGAPAELERWLTQDEVIQASQPKGFQEVVLQLARECFEGVQEAVKRATDASTAGAYEPYKDVAPVTKPAPEPSTEDVDWVLAGLEQPKAEE